MIDFEESGRIRPVRILIAAQAKWLRAVSTILIALASVALAGCAMGGAGDTGSAAALSGTVPAPESPQPAANKANGVVGVWDGLTLASCNTSSPTRCNAQEKVTLTLIQGASGMTGYYRCAYSTMDCLGQNETGKVVSASLNGGQITARVEMPDGTSCLYTGRTADNIVNGGYSCYAGGALIESGSWNGRRTY